MTFTLGNIKAQWPKKPPYFPRSVPAHCATHQRYWIFSTWILSCIICTSAIQPGKTQTQFEADRTALLRRVETIHRILLETEVKEKEGLGKLNALNVQIESNEMLIQTIDRELKSTNQEIQQRQKAVASLSKDLEQLQREYAAMVYVASRALHDIHELMFVFSASSFHNLVQRLRYVKQYARIRQNHFREINKAKALLQAQQNTAQQHIQAKQALLNSKQTEKTKLIRLQTQQMQLVGRLSRQHKQLMTELQQHNKGVKRLNKLLTDIIQQELRAQAARTSKAPFREEIPTTKKRPATAPRVDKKLTALFRKSQGKLPWPVKEGFMSRKFGVSPHPVLHNVQVENMGIDIQTSKGAEAFAIFEGVVKAIAFVPGMNRIVIIQHGAYHSVYAKLTQTTVKVGEYVQANTPLGTVYTDSKGTTELQLQLWRGKQKLNPTWWLSRN